ncbi:MAG: HEPN domain-containing protein [Bacteroidaceae bacterium]|nr:HEPN domain-containing protein [Bacteroidaceae bacterium]MEA5098931.1 HEPN domain-containing protein [Bacteroidales bacterium]
MEATIIDEQYKEGKELIDYLTSKKEVTFQTYAENNFRKNLLLSSASYFEAEITSIILSFAKKCSSNNEKLENLIKQKVINRQYHTYFDWENGSNANKFFSLFGNSFKQEMEYKIKQDNDLREGIISFMQIGLERNKMVHQNFAEIVIEKTAEEVYEMYKKAKRFIEVLKEQLLN